jgi:uncharacterized protein YpiB (UPF0302 family)
MTTDQKIRFMNSLTNAVNLVPKPWIDQLEDSKKLVEDLANWFYLLEPTSSAIEDKINACNSKEELATLKDEIAATNDKNVFAKFNQKIIELNDRESKTK